MHYWDWGYPGIILFIFIAIISLVVYFLPSIIAAFRRHPYTLAIFLINLILGVTGIGWIGALVWAFISPGTQLLPTRSALDIARERYARGEITAEQFEDIKRNLI